ncbi:MAG: hypothetical protein IJT94_10620 [Oscillibacter sp.]|nr:hypothetical protein [Oscillibacter sp.]
MKKRNIVIIAAAAVVIVAVGIYAAVRLKNHMTDITGVTSLPSRNQVIMNSRRPGSFVGGEGRFTVGESGKIHVEYAVTEGSVDIAFHGGSADLDVFLSSDIENLIADGQDLGADSVTGIGGAGLDVFQNADLENLSPDGEVFGASGVTGTGSLDFDAAPGETTVYFSLHDAVGTATVSAPTK